MFSSWIFRLWMIASWASQICLSLFNLDFSNVCFGWKLFCVCVCVCVCELAGFSGVLIIHGQDQDESGIDYKLSLFFKWDVLIGKVELNETIVTVLTDAWWFKVSWNFWSKFINIRPHNLYWAPLQNSISSATAFYCRNGTQLLWYLFSTCFHALSNTCFVSK